VKLREKGDGCVAELEFATPAEAIETAHSILARNARRAA